MEGSGERVTGRGMLRHRFWGTYSARVVVEFPDRASTIDALGTLRLTGPGWGMAEGVEAAGKYLVWVGDADALEFFKRAAAEWISPEPCNSFGCVNARHDIDGLEHSVDYGSPFVLTVPVVPAEQIGLVVGSDERGAGSRRPGVRSMSANETLAALGLMLDEYARLDEMLDAFMASAEPTKGERRRQRASNRERDKAQAVYRTAIKAAHRSLAQP